MSNTSPGPRDGINQYPLPTLEEIELSDTAMPFILHYTRPIISDPTIKLEKIKFGSGVLVRIKDRLFVVTASHCIEDRPLVVHDHNENFLPKPPTRVLNRKLSDDPDIGFLEIENDHNIAALPESCLDPDMPVVTPESVNALIQHPIVVVGFPVHDFKTKGSHVGMIMDNFGTHPVRVTEHLYKYSYPVSILHRLNPLDEHVKEMNFKPEGYSGGGVWTLKAAPKDKLVSSADLLTLHAIQSSWTPSKRELNCIPIRTLLRFIHEDYPDLRAHLEERFPYLRGAGQ